MTNFLELKSWWQQNGFLQPVHGFGFVGVFDPIERCGSVDEIVLVALDWVGENSENLSEKTPRMSVNQPARQLS